MFTLAALILAVGGARLSSDATVTPVTKVITLLKALQTEVQTEGTTEAGTYDTFSCFCRDQTTNKTGEISLGETSITTLTSTLNSKNALKATLTTDISNLQTEKAQLEADLKKATELREKEKAVYEVAHADASAAVSALERAIASISNSKSLVEVKSSVTQALLVADAVGIVPKNKKVLTALLSDEPEWEEPENEYDFHSDDIVSTLNDLLAEFKQKKRLLQQEENKAVTGFSAASAAKRGEITSTNTTLNTKKGTLSTTEGEITTTTGDLNSAKANLNDDQLYLKDLTEQCETRARQWDQRSQMRADELTAIQQALDLLEGTSDTTGVNTYAADSGNGMRTAPTMLAQTQEDGPGGEDSKQDDDTYEDVVFVQKKVVKKVDATTGRNRIISMLKAEAKKQNSAVLGLFTMKLAADPFAKVKTLIQQLIERLLAESEGEATKKGWCDTELTIAREERDFRHADVESLNAEIEQLESRKSKLLEDKDTYTTELAELNEALTNATTLRNSEKANNQDTLQDASNGLEALKKAITILDEFYKKAGRATVSLVEKKASPVATVSLVEKKASPVDADIAAGGKDAGFDGAYTGGQERATGVIGMLQTIQSDFERTIAKTTEMEEQAHRDFVKFSIESKASISSKERGLEHTENDLTITTGDLQAALEDLRENQDLLDKALQRLEVLKPACVDTGMSWTERVAKRQAEIDALKSALCTLDEEDGEYSSDCTTHVPGGFLQKS